MTVVSARERWRRALLAGGVMGALLYPAADLIAGHRYPGYSFSEQAVSELFAIGAPTSRLVVALFSLSSALFIALAAGVWWSSRGSRTLRALAVMILGNAVNSLLLWNFFPMHMRGVAPTFTDTMHGVLAINPFVLASLVLGAVYFRNWFRYYSLATILLLLVTAIMAFSSVSLFLAHQPTPGMGTTERVAQYNDQLWHAVLAMVLLWGIGGREGRSEKGKVRRERGRVDSLWCIEHSRELQREAALLGNGSPPPFGPLLNC